MTELFDNKYRIKSIRLSERDYSQPGSYFITLCTQDRKSYFGEIIDGKVQLNDMGKIIQDIWSEIPYHFKHIELDICMIMPNHIHCIITIHDRKDNSWNVLRRDNSWIISTNNAHNTNHTHQNIRRNMLLSKIIGKFKMQTAKYINQSRWTTWKFWQANYYEHIIRNKRDLERIRTYIINNPYKRKNDEIL